MIRYFPRLYTGSFLLVNGLEGHAREAVAAEKAHEFGHHAVRDVLVGAHDEVDRKSTRLNSSH